VRPLQKQILALASVTGTLLLVHFSLQTLALLRASDPPSPLYIERLAVLLVYFIVPLVAGWVSFRYWLLVPAGLGAVFIASLAFVVTHQPSFLFYYSLLEQLNIHLTVLCKTCRFGEREGGWCIEFRTWGNRKTIDKSVIL